jgi:hypothetical protein
MGFVESNGKPRASDFAEARRNKGDKLYDYLRPFFNPMRSYPFQANTLFGGGTEYIDRLWQ